MNKLADFVASLYAYVWPLNDLKFHHKNTKCRLKRLSIMGKLKLSENDYTPMHAHPILCQILIITISPPLSDVPRFISNLLISRQRSQKESDIEMMVPLSGIVIYVQECVRGPVGATGLLRGVNISIECRYYAVAKPRRNT